jgi:hypothetical protein
VSEPKKPAVDERAVAAKYLSDAVTGVKADDLLADPNLAYSVFERATLMHRTCGCERARRLAIARDVIVGVGQGSLL